MVTINGVEEDDTVIVYDQSGRKLMQQIMGERKTLDIRELRPGVYLVKLEGNDKRQTFKLVKQ